MATIKATQGFLNGLLCGRGVRGIVIAPENGDPAAVLVSNGHVMLAFDAGEVPPLFKIGSYTVFDGRADAYPPDAAVGIMRNARPAGELVDLVRDVRVTLGRTGSSWDAARVLFRVPGERRVVAVSPHCVELAEKLGLRLFANGDQAMRDAVVLVDRDERVRGLVMVMRQDQGQGENVQLEVLAVVPEPAAAGVRDGVRNPEIGRELPGRRGARRRPAVPRGAVRLR